MNPTRLKYPPEVYSPSDPHEVDSRFRGDKDSVAFEKKVSQFYEQGSYTKLVNSMKGYEQCELMARLTWVNRVKSAVSL